MVVLVHDLPLCVPVQQAGMYHTSVYMYGGASATGGGGISPVHRPPFPIAIDGDFFIDRTSFSLALWVPWKPLDEPTGYYS
jgi:hypothetical protein